MGEKTKKKNEKGRTSRTAAKEIKSDWAFLVPLDLGVASNAPPPLRFLNTIKDIDMKFTSLIKRHVINPLVLSYLSCDVT